MLHLVLEIFYCLLAAAAIGGLVGWILRASLARGVQSELERELQSRDAMLQRTRRDLEVVKTDSHALRADLARSRQMLESGTPTEAPDRSGEIEALSRELGLETRVREEAEARAREESERVSQMRLELEAAEAELDRLRQVREEPPVREVAARSEDPDLEAPSPPPSEEPASDASIEEAPDAGEPEPGGEPPAAPDRPADRAETGDEPEEQLDDDPTLLRPASRRDDLTRIRGIGTRLQRRLYQNGVERLDDLASLDEGGVQSLASRLRIPASRIFGDRWVEQARELVRELKD